MVRTFQTVDDDEFTYFQGNYLSRMVRGNFKVSLALPDEVQVLGPSSAMVTLRPDTNGFVGFARRLIFLPWRCERRRRSRRAGT